MNKSHAAIVKHMVLETLPSKTHRKTTLQDTESLKTHGNINISAAQEMGTSEMGTSEMGTSEMGTSRSTTHAGY